MGAAINRISLAVLYLVIYLATSLIIFFKLRSSNVKGCVSDDFSFVWLFCSIAGLPPLVGFLPKMFIIIRSSVALAFLMILSSVIIVYVYSSVVLSMKLKGIASQRGVGVFLGLSSI